MNGTRRGRTRFSGSLVAPSSCGYKQSGDPEPRRRHRRTRHVPLQSRPWRKESPSSTIARRSPASRKYTDTAMNLTAIAARFRTKSNQLPKDAGIGRPPRPGPEAADFAGLLGKFMGSRFRDQGAAVGDEELQAASGMENENQCRRSLIGRDHPRRSHPRVFRNFEERVSPGNRQPDRSNREIVLPESMIGIQLFEGIAARGQTHIDAHRQNKLHQARPVFPQLHHRAPEQIGQNDPDKVEVLSKFHDKVRNQPVAEAATMW